MNTLIYCNDLEALKAQLKAEGHYDEESNTYPLKHTLTPIKKKEIDGVFHSLSYVKDCILNLPDYPMLTDLGDYDGMFANETAHTLYKNVYDYTIPQSYTDENGVTQTRTISTKIGIFAGEST